MPSARIRNRLRAGFPRLRILSEAHLAVLGGGTLGSAARVGIELLVPASPRAFPWATLTVNLAGSLALGWYLARRERAPVGRWSLDFWAIGVLGSLTTFSAFSLELVRLLEVDHVLVAIAYLAASIFGGLGLALLGQRVGTVLR